MALWGLLAALAASAQIVERDLFSIPGISTSKLKESDLELQNPKPS